MERVWGTVVGSVVRSFAGLPDGLIGTHSSINLVVCQPTAVLLGITEGYGQRLTTGQLVIFGRQIGATLLHIEMQVGAGALPGVAAQADGSALLDAVAQLYRRPVVGQVKIPTDAPVIMLDENEILL